MNNMHLVYIKQTFNSSCADLTLKNPRWMLESTEKTSTHIKICITVLMIRATLQIFQTVSACYYIITVMNSNITSKTNFILVSGFEYVGG